MKTVNIQVPIEDTPFMHKIGKDFLGEYEFRHSDSEQRINHQLYNSLNTISIFSTMLLVFSNNSFKSFSLTLVSVPY